MADLDAIGMRDEHLAMQSRSQSNSVRSPCLAISPSTRCAGRLPRCCSLWASRPPYVMAQLEHTTGQRDLALYARQMDRRDGEQERLETLVTGGM